MTALLDRWDAFAEAEAAPPWLAERRRAGIARARTAGFPTQKDEDWKFTSVAAIAGADLWPVAGRADAHDAPTRRLLGISYYKSHTRIQVVI